MSGRPPQTQGQDRDARHPGQPIGLRSRRGLGLKDGANLAMISSHGKAFPSRRDREFESSSSSGESGKGIDESMAVAIDGEIFQHAYLAPLKPESEIYLIPKIGGG